MVIKKKTHEIRTNYSTEKNKNHRARGGYNFAQGDIENTVLSFYSDTFCQKIAY